MKHRPSLSAAPSESDDRQSPLVPSSPPPLFSSSPRTPLRLRTASLMQGNVRIVESDSTLYRRSLFAIAAIAFLVGIFCARFFTPHRQDLHLRTAMFSSPDGEGEDRDWNWRRWRYCPYDGRPTGVSFDIYIFVIFLTKYFTNLMI